MERENTWTLCCRLRLQESYNFLAINPADAGKTNCRKMGIPGHSNQQEAPWKKEKEP